jgi:hypothetical protein
MVGCERGHNYITGIGSVVSGVVTAIESMAIGSVSSGALLTRLAMYDVKASVMEVLSALLLPLPPLLSPSSLLLSQAQRATVNAAINA